MELTLLWNTFVVDSNSAFVQIRNDTLASAKVTASNNIFAGTAKTFLVVNSTTRQNYTVAGDHNWFVTGANVSTLTGSLFGASPGFTDAAQLDFTLAPSSTCRGAADTSASPAPRFEYFLNETVTAQYRARTAVGDLGAFDSTTTGPGMR
jgi:hypothetical protein